MKVTFLLPDFSDAPVGGFKIVYQHANKLVEKGFDVQIFLSRVPDSGIRQPIRGRLSTIKQKTLRKHPHNWFPLDKKIRVIYAPSLDPRYVPDADAVVATAWQTAEAMNAYPQRCGTKFYFIQSHEIWSGDESRVNATWKMPFKKLVIAGWLQELATKMGEQSTIIPNAIDYTYFPLKQSIDDRKPKLCMMYHTAEWKGSKYGIQAINKVKQKYPDLEVTFFSVYPEGDLVPAYVNYQHQPKPSELVDIYNSSTIFISPSLIEGWPLPPAEAMACGCALVCTDIGGVRDYAIDNKTALLAKPESSDSLADRIIELLDDDMKRIKIAKSGNEYLHKNFNWDNSSQLLAEALKAGIVKE